MFNYYFYKAEDIFGSNRFSLEKSFPNLNTSLPNGFYKFNIWTTLRGSG